RGRRGSSGDICGRSSASRSCRSRATCSTPWRWRGRWARGVRGGTSPPGRRAPPRGEAPSARGAGTGGGPATCSRPVGAGRPGGGALSAAPGEVYGNATRTPTREDEPVRPVSPYAASKAAAELACSVSGLDVVVARAANTEGPGRDERFAVGSWTRQLARLE